MLVKEVCTLDVVCCSAQTSALEAAQLMRHKHVGDLVVVDDPKESREPLGVVTDRDLVVGVLANGEDPAKTALTSLMHRRVVIAHEDEDTSTVIARMREHGVRRVPVVDREGTTVGIITLNDMLKALVDDASALLQIMSKGRHDEQRLSR